MSMAKINRVDANIFDIPAGANTTKTGAVYINNGNYRIEPTDGRKGVYKPRKDLYRCYC